MLLGDLNSDVDVPPGMLSALQDSGFVLIPHAMAPERLKGLIRSGAVLFSRRAPITPVTASLSRFPLIDNGLAGRADPSSQSVLRQAHPSPQRS